MLERLTPTVQPPKTIILNKPAALTTNSPAVSSGPTGNALDFTIVSLTFLVSFALAKQLCKQLCWIVSCCCRSLCDCYVYSLVFCLVVKSEAPCSGESQGKAPIKNQQKSPQQQPAASPATPGHPGDHCEDLSIQSDNHSGNRYS